MEGRGATAKGFKGSRCDRPGNYAGSPIFAAAMDGATTVLIFLPHPGFTARPTIFVPCRHCPQPGFGVILDVVYNHAGPEGNFLKSFAPDYFTDRYSTDWGEAFNFEGPRLLRCANFLSPMRVTGLTNSTWTGFAWTPRKIFTTLPGSTSSRRSLPGAPGRRRTVYHRGGGKRTRGSATGAIR